MAEIVFQAPNRLLISGCISFAVANRLRQAGQRLIAQKKIKQLFIDMQAVEATDSSGLTILLSWLRAAQQVGCILCIEHAPVALVAVAKLSGVDTLLFNAGK